MRRRGTLTGLAAVCLIGFVIAGVVSISAGPIPAPRIGLLGELTPAQESEVLQALIQGPVDLTSLQDVKECVEKVSWVHRAYVSRDFSGDLALDIRIQQPIAYWNDRGFINPTGEVFETAQIVGGNLPHLYGPPGSAGRVMDEYLELNRKLFKSSRLIELLRLDDRGAWEFEDQTGIRVLLGKDNIRQRLERTAEVLAAIETRGFDRQPVRVDARYDNGVSVEWSMTAADLAMNKKL
ncbi:MAG: cell division protein FtsQ/DivIB [Proteobacteria bacterium]|nr:cell division protein FtsQ/DivIB [Pseudomonadota bacterium]